MGAVAQIVVSPLRESPIHADRDLEAAIERGPEPAGTPTVAIVVVRTGPTARAVVAQSGQIALVTALAAVPDMTATAGMAQKGAVLDVRMQQAAAIAAGATVIATAGKPVVGVMIREAATVAVASVLGIVMPSEARVDRSAIDLTGCPPDRRIRNGHRAVGTARHHAMRVATAARALLSRRSPRTSPGTSWTVTSGLSCAP